MLRLWAGAIEELLTAVSPAADDDWPSSILLVSITNIHSVQAMLRSAFLLVARLLAAGPLLSVNGLASNGTYTNPILNAGGADP